MLPCSYHFLHCLYVPGAHYKDCGCAFYTSPNYFNDASDCSPAFAVCSPSSSLKVPIIRILQ